MTEEQKTKKGTNDNRAFSRMKEEIEAVAKRKADKILEEAEEEAEKITNKAENEAKNLKNKKLSDAKSEAEREQVREISRKKLDVQMNYLQTRESIIDDIMVEAQSELQKYTKSDKYADFLGKLVKSTGVSIGGGNLILHLRTEDKNHFSQDSLNKISEEINDLTGVDTSISVADDDLKALGGIKIVRADGKLFVDNTFEKRLERKTEEIRVDVLELLE